MIYLLLKRIDFEVFQTDRALFIVHFELTEFELNRGEVLHFDFRGKVFMGTFLIDQLNHEINDFKVLLTLFDSVFPVELNLDFIIIHLFGLEFGLNH